MQIKPLLLVGLAIVILGLAVFTTSLGNFVEIPSVTLPGLSTLLTPQSNEYFQIVLTANKGALNGQIFSVTNSTFSTEGLCIGAVKAYGANLQMDRRCEIELDQFNGQITFTTINTIDVAAQTSTIEVDDFVLTPTNDRRIAFSILPTDYTLTNLIIGKLTLPSVTGEIKRFKPTGEEDQVKNLQGEQLEITNFIGALSLSKNTIVLRGFATKVNWFI